MQKQDLLNVLKKYENEDFIVKSEEQTVTVYDGKGEPLYWFYFQSDGDITFQLLFLQGYRIGTLAYWVDDDFNEIINTLEQARKTLNIDGLRALAYCLYDIGYGDGYEVGYNDNDNE